MRRISPAHFFFGFVFVRFRAEICSAALFWQQMLAFQAALLYVIEWHAAAGSE
jgi:hypothetical protein